MAKLRKKKEQDQSQGISGHRSRVFYIGLGMTFLVFLFWAWGAFDRLELGSVDWRFERRGPRAPKTAIAIVGIDDESLNVWVEDNGAQRRMPERWTWPRGFYGKLIDKLHKAGAKLIAFDMVFSESSVRDKAEDQAFADAAKRAGNVIFAERFVAKNLEGGQQALKQETLIHPLDLAKLDKGHANVFHDVDTFIRSYRLLLSAGDGKLDPGKTSLDLAVVRQFLWGKPVVPDVSHEDRIVLDGGDGKPLVIPHDGSGLVDINYAGPPETFPTFKFHDVYYETMDMSVFKGRIVFIGSTSQILQDNHRAPFTTKDNPMPGVETHAHMVDTIATRDFLRRYPPYVELLLLLTLGVLTSFLTFRVKPLLGAAVMLLELAIFAVLALYLFAGSNLILPMVSPMASIMMSYLGIAVYRGFVEERRAKSFRAMFSRYVSRQIVDEILKNPDAVKLGGEVKEVSILFSDVRGFTAMSERLSAPEVVEVLNEYLTGMVDVVIANKGTVDKYVGDAIMAVWGSPLHDPEHWQNSMRTAVQMMEVLHELRKKWKAEGKPEIDIGIGIHSGHVVAGNMGHPQYKMDYTVIGDDVNLAARLESANKELKAHILISGTTYEAVKDMVDIVKHPDIHVKGKEKAVEVYEVIGWKGQGRADWAAPLKG